MDFRLLGPIEVSDGELPIELGPARQRALLALLLLDAGRVVTSDRLIDGLWGERAPASARKMVQVYVSQLRKLLPDDMLRTRGPGYSIEVGAGELDVARVEQLGAEGRRAVADDDLELAADRLRAALALWRGPALGEFDEPFARPERARLEDLRLTLLEARIDADLALGRHDDVPRSWTCSSSATPSASGCAPSRWSRSTAAGARPRPSASTARAGGRSPTGSESSRRRS